MANERTILCGELASASPRPKGPHVLPLHFGRPNDPVHLRIEDISRDLMQDIPDQWLDLIEIATYVYIADQAVSRGGDGVEEVGANWRRSLSFEVPVRCPDFWRATRVTTVLQGTLSFLSEDEYEFRFHQMKKPPALDRYLRFSEARDGTAPKQVILYSGGIDSLGGVIQEAVVNKRHSLVVRHRSTSKLEVRQRLLQQMIAEKAGDTAPVHITVDINKAKELNHEYTQRSRSFLYASLAATIAKTCGLSGIRFFENGVVSLNLPVSHQVVGARATRTTHPRVLNGFQDLFTLVAEQPFSVTNGFQWLSKADVIKVIARAGCAGLLEYSQSCTHTWEWTKKHPHCGLCSQCIDRRFAVLAADMEAHDPGDRYRVDLLVGPRDEGQPRMMLASYVEAALQIPHMSALDFFGRFGEVGRIVRQIAGSPDENARKVFNLYKQHGDEVAKVIDDGIARYRTQIRTRSLPASCLLRLVHDPSVPSDGTSAPAAPTKSSSAIEAKPPENLFRRKGKAWVYRFRGKDEMILLPCRGAAYLHRLLATPGTQMSVAELVIGVAKVPEQYLMGNADKAFDKEAHEAYRASYQDLKEDLEQATADGNEKEIDRIKAAMTALASQLKKVGLGGKVKHDNSVRNRLRNSVCNAIVRAIKDIEPDDKELASHLSECVKRGYNPVYQPPNGIAWET